MASIPRTDAFLVDGVDLVIGTSSFLREHSHGKDMVAIEKAAIEVINYVKRYAADGGITISAANGIVAEVLKSAFRQRTASE